MLHIRQTLAENFGYFGGGLIAPSGLLGVQLLDDRHQPVGDLGIGFADGAW
jgi:hypothetical protein